MTWVGQGRTWHTGGAEATASWAQWWRVLQHADERAHGHVATQ
jgi:hypothetical protein